MKHELLINRKRIKFLREMFETYQSLMEGVYDEDCAIELAQVRKYALPVIEELERAYEKKYKRKINAYEPKKS